MALCRERRLCYFTRPYDYRHAKYEGGHVHVAMRLCLKVRMLGYSKCHNPEPDVVAPRSTLQRVQGKWSNSFVVGS